MKKVVPVLVFAFALSCFALAVADVPDVSGLTLDELIELQGTVNEQIAQNATYTLLPGIYDCKNDFKWSWYTCRVKAGNDGAAKTATISFHKYTPDYDPFLTYEVSSEDDGIKLSMIQFDSTAELFMVIQGASLEAIPNSGF